MSTTYAALTAEITGRLKLSSTDVDRFKVGESINRAQIHILNILDQKFLTEAIRTVRGDLTEDIVLYQYPADFMRFLKLWINFTTTIPAGDPANIGRPARLVGDTDIATTNRNEQGTTSYPKISLGVEGGFEIRPKPTAAVTKGWRLRHVYKLPTVTSDQPCLLRDNKINILIYYACALSAMVDDYSKEMFDQHMALFKDEAAPFLPKSETKQSRKG